MRRFETPQVPATIVPLAKLPMSANGKVDRAALPETTSSPEGTARTAPRDSAEAMVSAIWAEVLGRPDPDVHADFFKLGGNSLLAAQALFRLGERVSRKLPAALLFRYPTIAGAAAELRRLTGGEESPGQPAAAPETPSGQAPLSIGQQALWILDKLLPKPAAYNVAVSLWLRGSLDADALCAALTEIVHRHEALCSRFALGSDGVPLQIVIPASSFAVAEEALPLPVRDDSLELAVAIAQRDAGQPLDLAVGPLIRARLIRMSGANHLLALTVHHAAFDGWSLGVLLDELQVLYTAYHEGKPPPLPPLTAQYRDFAIRQREWWANRQSQPDRAYWLRLLADAPVLALPVDRSRPVRPTGTGDQYCLELQLPGKLRDIPGIASAHGATSFMLLLALFMVTLARWTGQTDIVVGTPVAGREQPDSQHLIGYFANMLALRTDLAGDPTLEDVLGRVRAVALSAYAHQDVPFEFLVGELNPRRDWRNNPIFQVVFSVQDQAKQAIVLPDLEVSLIDIYNCTAKFDLHVNAIERIDGHLVVFEYNTDVLEHDTVERLANDFQLTTIKALGNPGLPISKL